MATRTGRLFQDQNLSAHINGAGTVSGKADFTGQRKTRAGGRKPLGDLSNAGKPINQVDGKKGLDSSVNTGKLSVSQVSKPLGSKKGIKASEKSLSGSRKALSDISNLGKPHVPEIKNKNNLKPSSLTEESLHLSAIAEERMLHNHKECIKSQFETVDVLKFFKTIELGDDSDDPMTICFEPPKLKVGLQFLMFCLCDSPCWELEEVPEHLAEVQSLSIQHESPAHSKTPKLAMWNDFAADFKLIETPKLPKN
ncbi:uncharacterized protein LOC133305196 [Gastrolobium bilobum]|uniref:uncharacterized protein LOC133305196 n=1 Tax=Gastrolobium bilobum TaxID=150636 RepID=UPI002AB012AB|nr:uncharacterized protein LOC133305196 [Gastrolobium bilobum]